MRRLFDVLLVVVLTCGLPAGVTADAAPGDQVLAAGGSGERSADFGAGWRFALANRTGITDPTGAFAHAQDVDFDDSGWRRVSVPHDWSIELTPTPEGGTTSGTGFLPGGLGWYRKTFTLPRSLAGKRISIEFDGVYMDSYVYVNGQQVANHPYGYTGFAVDMTSLAHTDGRTPNVVAVKVQHQLPSSRWYSGSGIYRKVHLVVTDPVHIARHGVYVTTPDLAGTIGSGFATVRARTTAVDERGDTAEATVVSTVEDAGGRRVARKRTPVPLGADPGTVGADLRVDRPILWSPENPYLYTLRTELVVGGRVVDATTTPFGIRWFVFDPNEGFSLNGVPTKLYGVNLHHDLGALGAAVNSDAIVRQLTIMKGMGVNALRTSHNPPAPEVIEACQRLGILMMVEAFDTWRRPKVQFDYGRFFDAHSDADIAEMVHAAKNSPAVVLWSIGNEIPDSTSVAVGVPIARRLIADVRAIDTTRPIVMGSDKYRSVPAPGSAQDQILGLLDGMGLNYNTAGSVDALHARYPTKFFFESESSSETSTRGAYQDPHLLNTGENYTPGKRDTSSYDNNMASWTMSHEYGLKKDRDRKFFAGMFLWSGIDYIGEPTPYDVFPVKSSFFGAVDTAGFPKDAYYAYVSQWTTAPMVHLVPMNWTDHEPGEPVTVWAYSTVDTVELFLNGASLGERRFDHKTTPYGREYLETTEPTGDDKNVTTGPFPGSYTSPNGSAGKLHLTWEVPFAPGRLVAVAKRDGVAVARDELVTAGAPAALRLTPDRRRISADGESQAFVTAEVVDAAGVVVPGATTPISFGVHGGRLVGLDNGRQESAENYTATTRTAWAGKALAMVRAGDRAGPVTITASAPGLRSDRATVLALPAGNGTRPASVDPVPADPAPPSTADDPVADASYSGAPNTLPAAMLDGVTTSGGWSNAYVKAATALLPAVSSAHAREWVSVAWRQPHLLGQLSAYFTLDATRTLPASITVSYWDGDSFVPATNQRITWATESNQPTVIAFDAVQSRLIRLDMTSRAPNTSNGFLQIAELQPVGS
ncbi:MAG TPA: glycoside hydrolase family 2 TIM barrel-domain containing protein [Actinophytocola sp.]|uniref:glycoside hydrolase family 2 TIM barrel-domain containing protein n=1 Tax=Actinophytocola sp. TaxID=1872138 RepID=UPI002DDD09A6|nr:glycoside hydrolase family 2 TIM barrel-domain containing protein [Actinophytocola sp.]HEV2782782.1 glycoside hydrolase family 2 TIM barrel-domain containing protein [Actinophytocola sp.]